MTTVVHLDTSARPGRSGTDPHGSHTRRLTHRFVTRWRAMRPQDLIVHRDLGASPPSFIDGRWIEAAFAPPERHAAWMREVLAESDTLVDELLAADVLLIGAPLYNFGMPASLKAWIDNVVRVGRTVEFDTTNPDDPYVPLLNDRPRQAVVLSSRGGHGFDPGGAFAHMNHLEPALHTALDFIGIKTLHTVAIEHQESGGELLARSIATAERRVDALVDTLSATHPSSSRRLAAQA